MSPELQGAIVGGLIALVAALLGGAFTIWLQRTVRERGELRARVLRADVSVHGKLRPQYRRSTHESERIVVNVESQIEQMHEFEINYNFRIALFNEKDVDTGLSDIGGTIIGPDGRDFAPLRGNVYTGDNMLNVPSRKWITFNLASEDFGGDKLDPAKNTRALKIRAKLPDGRDYESPRLEYEANDYLGEKLHYSV